MFCALLQHQFSPTVRKKTWLYYNTAFPKGKQPNSSLTLIEHIMWMCLCFWAVLWRATLNTSRVLDFVKVQWSFRVSPQSCAKHLRKCSVMQGTQEPAMMIFVQSTTSIVNYCLARQCCWNKPRDFSGLDSDLNLALDDIKQQSAEVCK